MRRSWREAVLAVLGAAVAMAGCERGRVVLENPEVPPDLAGVVVVSATPHGLYAVRDGAGEHHEFGVPAAAVVTRRIANLVTTLSADSIREGSFVEVWWRDDPAAAGSGAAVRLARRVTVVDLAELYGTGFVPPPPPPARASAGASPRGVP